MRLGERLTKSLQLNWQDLLAEHDRWLRTIVYSRLRDADAVDEVMQEIAVAAVRQAAPLSDASKVVPWLYRLAVRQVLLHRRKKFDGQVLIAYGIIYSIFRFLIEFLRDDPQRGDLFGLNAVTGLSPSQMISLFVAAASIVFMIWRLRASSAETRDEATVSE